MATYRAYSRYYGSMSPGRPVTPAPTPEPIPTTVLILCIRCQRLKERRRFPAQSTPPLCAACRRELAEAARAIVGVIDQQLASLPPVRCAICQMTKAVDRFSDETKDGAQICFTCVPVWRSMAAR